MRRVESGTTCDMPSWGRGGALRLGHTKLGLTGLCLLVSKATHGRDGDLLVVGRGGAVW